MLRILFLFVFSFFRPLHLIYQLFFVLLTHINVQTLITHDKT